MKKPPIIKKEFIDKFAKNEKLSDFQKYHLTFLIASIRSDYETGLKYNEYIDQNREIIANFINELDSESKIEVKNILNTLEFMKNHTLMETIENYIMKGEKVLDHLKAMEFIRGKYKLPIDIYEESIFKYKHGLKYLPQDIIKSLENKDFLDCGAYIGESSLMFERDYNPNKIFSFEPIPDNYAYLLENIKSNNLQKVIPIKTSVGEKSGKIHIIPLGPTSFVSEKGNIETEVISIDEFVSERNISVGLIKVDVEGYELEVLKGAIKTIKKFKPVLLIGIYHHPKEFFGTKRYIQDITRDYQFKIKFLSDIRPLAEIHLIAW
jgi:FkbM family methyltransferase